MICFSSQLKAQLKIYGLKNVDYKDRKSFFLKNNLF